MNYGQIYRRVVAEGGFDTSAANTPLASVQQWVQEAYAEMCVEARWLEAVKQLGVTVVGQGQYTFDNAGVAEILRLYVAATGFAGYGPEYARVGFSDLQAVKSGQRQLSRGVEGIFGEAYDSAGTPLVELYPGPSVAGAAITALCNLEPPALGSVAGDADVPVFPAEYHSGIVYGATALGIEFVDEGDPSNFRTRYEAIKGKVKSRKRRRMGSGPVQIQVAGIHF